MAGTAESPTELPTEHVDILVVGNGMALVRPPDRARTGDLERAPVRRSVVMIVIGAVAAIWALATLLAG